MTRVRTVSRGICAAATAGVALAALCFAGPAAAELAVLDDGRYYKVTGYELRGDAMRLELRDGGRITLPAARIARVVDDEWVPPPEPEPTPARRADWTFVDGAAVPSVPYGPEIHGAARRHGLAPDLVAAVARAESAFDAGAVSSKGARGLMQLMPATARRFGVSPDRIHDAAANLDAGVRYLAWLLERFEGDLALALAAYNAGEGTVDRYGGVPPFRETRGYLERIFRFLSLEPGNARTGAATSAGG